VMDAEKVFIALIGEVVGRLVSEYCGKGTLHAIRHHDPPEVEAECWHLDSMFEMRRAVATYG
jgi:hypothetical protein